MPDAAVETIPAESADKFGPGPESSPSRTEVLQNLLALNPGDVRAITADLKKYVTEDYRASKVETSVIEEIPEIITTLTDVFGLDKDGNLEVKKDERGNWVDVIGPKGQIPGWYMPFNQQANFSSIFLRLEDGCYETEYELDIDGTVLSDEKGMPKIKSRKCTSIAVELRNLNQTCMLGLEGGRAVLQAKIFGGLRGGMPIGFDGNIDKLIVDMIGKHRK